jgi:hypothetical protein
MVEARTRRPCSFPQHLRVRHNQHKSLSPRKEARSVWRFASPIVPIGSAMPQRASRLSIALFWPPSASHEATMEKFILPQQGWLALQDASTHSAASTVTLSRAWATLSLASTTALLEKSESSVERRRTAMIAAPKSVLIMSHPSVINSIQTTVGQRARRSHQPGGRRCRGKAVMCKAATNCIAKETPA